MIFLNLQAPATSTLSAHTPAPATQCWKTPAGTGPKDFSVAWPASRRRGAGTHLYYVRTDQTISPIETARLCENYSWKLKSNNNSNEWEWEKWRVCFCSISTLNFHSSLCFSFFLYCFPGNDCSWDRASPGNFIYILLKSFILHNNCSCSE